MEEDTKFTQDSTVNKRERVTF